ncbi:MAG: VWA domain-containing protein [Flavobacteriaceae bacterium]|nr:VWA domain-containing protein [Flavobacteriaceae bacterium]
MSLTTVLLISLAAIVALGFVIFKYFVGTKKRTGSIYFLAALRFVSIFLLLLLLINPKIKQQQFEVIKPQLLIAIDQSVSIDYLEKGDSVRLFADYLINHPKLQERFSIQTYGFGKELSRIDLDSLAFNKQQTNISKVLNSLEKLNSSNQTAIVLLSDGNQTVGEDFQYFTSRETSEIFPVVTGDTTAQTDLSISNLNVNKYAFLNNKFPIEVILNYSGNTPVQSRFEIKSANSVLFTKTIDFNSDDNSEIITTTLTANKLGTYLFEAVITPLPSEKNTINNSKKFGIEVIDERTSVLILTSVSHPDLGMLKKSIESNEQREAKIDFIENYKNIELNDFQLVILYQPNNQFRSVFEDIRTKNLNSFIITGTQTDWDFLNSAQQYFRKDHTPLSQEISPIYNENYSQFQFENLGFNQFPPLVDAFGFLNFKNETFSSMLFQKLEGVPTNSPLLVTFQNNFSKQAVLFGENVWKWRAQSFMNNSSFDQFDTFIGKLVQYLSATLNRDRLTFEAESFYLENEEINISAQYFDQNYQFNPDGKLVILIKNLSSNEVLEIQMLPGNNQFKVQIENPKPGDYSFEIKEQASGILGSGTFSILGFNVEQQFSGANLAKLQSLAKNNQEGLYFLNDPEAMVTGLIADNRFVTMQKNREKTLHLISWKFLLALLVLSLSTEWFARKYFGLI